MTLYQSKHLLQRDTCRLCGGKKLEVALQLTPTALCDAYVSQNRVSEAQEVFPLELFLCRDCGYVHLTHVVDPEIIYRDYIYVTTSSLGLSAHFERYAEEVLGKLKPPLRSLVVDIGSNDGTLLQSFKKRGMAVLGIEPATEIARGATASGIETLPEFFTPGLAREIKRSHGSAAIVTINNLFANIDNLEEVMKGILEVLAADGVLVIESSYLADMIQNMVFDFIYHEHLSYFSVKPLESFFPRYGLELCDIDRVPTKGGSLRYYVQRRGGGRSVSRVVGELIAYERDMGLDRKEIFQEFCSRINKRKSQLLEKLRELKAQGKTIAGYGASATTTTLIYHFGISEMMDYIVDDNPAKQNTYSPGFHIPVVPSDALYERKPDYVVMLAWRYFDPIVKKHHGFLLRGGCFIRPLPDFEIVGKS